LKLSDALREAEEFLRQFTVLYPNESIIPHAIRGCTAYQLSWFDAHLWSDAEHFGLSEILSEDFQHDRHDGTVRIVNRFEKPRGKAWLRSNHGGQQAPVRKARSIQISRNQLVVCALEREILEVSCWSPGFEQFAKRSPEK
jgi:hypothetical protein